MKKIEIVPTDYPTDTEEDRRAARRAGEGGGLSLAERLFVIVFGLFMFSLFGLMALAAVLPH
jgi:hypothetical protein